MVRYNGLGAGAFYTSRLAASPFPCRSQWLQRTRQARARLLATRHQIGLPFSFSGRMASSPLWTRLVTAMCCSLNLLGLYRIFMRMPEPQNQYLVSVSCQ